MAISGRQLRFRREYHVIQPGSARFPRRFAPRNDNSEVHTILTMACTDRQHCAGRGMPLPYNGVYNRREYPEICSCQWRSLTAATDAIGTYHFNDSLSKSAVPSRDCHVGLWPPRNDTSGGTALTAVHPIDLAVLLPLRGRAGHAPPLQTHQCRPIPNFSFLIPNMINKAAPHHSARAFVERFFVEARFEKCRRALCTSSFSNRRIGEKYPAKAEGAMMRCCHK